MPESGPATLRGTISLGVGEAVPDGAPPVLVKFVTGGVTASGLKVNRLDVLNVVRGREGRTLRQNERIKENFLGDDLNPCVLLSRVTALQAFQGCQIPYGCW